MQSTLKTTLNYHDQSGKVLYRMKTTQDNDLIDRACVVYAENNTKLLWSIGPSAIYDENQTRKLCDW